VQEKRRETSDKRAEQRKRLLAAAGDDETGQDAGAETGDKKLSRGMRQREKKRLQREAGNADTTPNPGGEAEAGGNTRGAKKQRTTPPASAAAGPRTARGAEGGDAAAAKPRRGRNAEARGAVDAEGAAPEFEAFEALPTGEKGGPATKKRKGKSGPKRDDFDAQVKTYKAALFGAGSAEGSAEGASAKFKESAARWFE
jgi:hypothetical protein